jgi:NADH:ubiquinone oxidoreductase subunit K
MINSPIPIVSAFLFCIGLAIVLSKKNIIFLLIGLELILNAANINLVYFSQFDKNPSQGQFFVLLIIMLAAAEISLGLAIALKIRKYFGSVNPDSLNEIKEN